MESVRLTAEQVYDRLVNVDGIKSVDGQIRFFLGDVDIIVKQKDVVGNIIQEWLQGWMDKRGIEYGWDVAVYSSIEHIYGYDYVTSCYKDNPQDSWKQIVDYMHEMYPEATDKQIRKVLK